MAKVIAFQGERGANSEIACFDVYPDWQALPCATFEDAFAALGDGTADLAMIPIENSIAGRVAEIAYKEGDFLPADVPDASVRNERNAVRIEATDGTTVGVVQIAGLVARRIVCEVAVGDELALGQTYGLIRFGSRVDTYLPAGTVPQPIVGQRTIGGETLLAVLG